MKRGASSLTVLLRDKTTVGERFQTVPGNEVFHAAVFDVLFDLSLMIVIVTERGKDLSRA